MIARLLAIALVSLFPTMAIAQNLANYQPGPRLIDGSQLNLMVAAVNNLTNSGTPGPVSGSIFYAGNGTVSLPSFTFSSDPDTGLYRIGANNIGIALGGANVVNITTSGLSTTGIISVTSASNTAFTVGRVGGTNPVLQIDASTALVATGLKITGAAAAGGVAAAVISSGTNESLTLDAKGTGTVSINSVATGAISLGTATNVVGNFSVASTVFTVAAASGNTVVGGTLGVTGVATFTAIPIAPATGITIGTTTFTEAALALYTKGVAAGYKIARGEDALDNTNPTPVATGLTSIVACSLTMKTASSPVLSTSVLTYDTTAGTLNMYGWKPTANNDTTLVASDGTQTVGWVCVGT